MMEESNKMTEKAWWIIKRTNEMRNFYFSGYI